MDDSMAQPRSGFARPDRVELQGWRAGASWFSAIVLALLFVAAGVWKITDVEGAAMRMAQAKVPESLSTVAALAFGIAETFGGVLVLVPRLRRWGAAVIGLLLVAFVIYMGVNYQALQGEDCSCFPWLKRAVGPAFFIGDGAMLALAVMAGVWSRRPSRLRNAGMVLGAVAVFALVSYGVTTAAQSGTRAPETITVEGQPYSLGRGKVFLYFFNPECTHCFDAAKRMARFDWGGTKVLAVPVEVPQYAASFLKDSGLRAAVSTDFEKLKPVFGYPGYPFGVALERGRQKATLTKFEGAEPEQRLKELGFIR
jgi:uncharacterized membrane protein YphA (DoxX/SURF4 family)